jgi:hypothetical protein
VSASNAFSFVRFLLGKSGYTGIRVVPASLLTSPNVSLTKAEKVPGPEAGRIPDNWGNLQYSPSYLNSSLLAKVVEPYRGPACTIRRVEGFLRLIAQHELDM